MVPLTQLSEPGMLVEALGVRVPLLSSAYMIQANVNCFWLLRQVTRSAFCLAFASAGSNSAARMAMMAITTSNSISVKPLFPVSDRKVDERSEEHTSELQSLRHLVCRLLLEKKKKTQPNTSSQGVLENRVYSRHKNTTA